MSLDTMLCGGILLVLFGVPSVLAAWADARSIRLRLITPLVGLGILAYVSLTASATHSPDQWIHAILRVIAQIRG